MKQLGRRVDEPGGVFTLCERRVRNELIQEAQVGYDAPDPEFPQRAMHARNGFFGGRRPGGDLHQQRVIGAGDDCAGVGSAGIQPHTKARGAAIRRDAAIVRNEVVFRILGGDPALQRMGIDPDLVLGGHATFRRTDPGAAGDPDLCLHEVDARGTFSDGVLNLDARIDFDEVETAVSASCRNSTVPALT